MVQENKWSVEFYRDDRGRTPVEDFIDGLARQLRAKVYRNIDLLEELGSLPMPLGRPMTGYQFSELRAQAGGNIARIFYMSMSGRRVVLLHGFLKKTQQTPRRELTVASRRREEVMRRAP